MRNSVTFGEADSLVMWPQPDLSEPVTKGRNIGNKSSDHERSKSRKKTHSSRSVQPPADYTVDPRYFASNSSSSGFQARLHIYVVLPCH
jgi:hypothetical protein